MDQELRNQIEGSPVFESMNAELPTCCRNIWPLLLFLNDSAYCGAASVWGKPVLNTDLMRSCPKPDYFIEPRGQFEFQVT